MPSRAFVEASLTFLFVIVSLYLLNVTFGSAMDALYYNFNNLIPTLHMAGSWQTVSYGTLTNWTYFWNAFIAVCIATGVWWVRKGTMDVQYSRGFN